MRLPARRWRRNPLTRRRFGNRSSAGTSSPSKWQNGRSTRPICPGAAAMIACISASSCSSAMERVHADTALRQNSDFSHPNPRGSTLHAGTARARASAPSPLVGWAAKRPGVRGDSAAPRRPQRPRPLPLQHRPQPLPQPQHPQRDLRRGARAAPPAGASPAPSRRTASTAGCRTGPRASGWQAGSVHHLTRPRQRPRASIRRHRLAEASDAPEAAAGRLVGRRRGRSQDTPLFGSYLFTPVIPSTQTDVNRNFS